MLLTERLYRASYIPSHHESECVARPLVESATIFETSARLFGSTLDSRTPPADFDQEEEYYSILHPLASYTASYARDIQIAGNFVGGALTTCAVGGGMIYAAATMPLIAPALASVVALGGLAAAAYPAVRGLLNQPPPAKKYGLCALFRRGMLDTALLVPVAAGYVGARLGTAIGLIGAPVGTLIGGCVIAVRRFDDHILTPLLNCGALNNAKNLTDAVTERVLSCPRPHFSFDAYTAGTRLRQHFTRLSKKATTPATLSDVAPQLPTAPKPPETLPGTPPKGP